MLNTYTCMICGQQKDQRIEPWDYYNTGVICQSCKDKLEEEEEES